jgi:hypothetical protein
MPPIKLKSEAGGTIELKRNSKIQRTDEKK